MALRRFRIEADGSVLGTRVFDADTGEAIKGIKAVTWRHEATHAPVIILEFHNQGPVSAKAEREETA